MKDLFKSKAKQKSPSTQSSKQAVAKREEVDKFLSKVAAMPKTGGDARLIFALDATASRQPTWDMATQLQAEMFTTAQSLGGLNLQLCYFRGLAEFYRSDWQTNGSQLLRLMTQIRCEAGATQLKRTLQHAIRENESKKVKAVVFIGDAMEENPDTLAQLAGKLGLLNVPLFIFQEGRDPIAADVFQQLSKLSGGAYSHFDAAGVEQLKELLKAVAVYAAGGLRALQDFSKKSSQSVKLLERQLKS